MTSTAWCYTTDSNYLLPTIVSASQAKRSLGESKDKVYILYFGDNSSISKDMQKVAECEGVIFIASSKKSLEGSPMTYARFYVGKIIAGDCDYIVYLDGDTQVKGDLVGLSEAAPKSGGLLAAPDLMSLMTNGTAKQWQQRSAYFRRLGIMEADQRRYFNAGVIKARLCDWQDISSDCIKLLNNNPGKFTFHDQDALNIIMKGRQELISLRWNWPAFFGRRGLEDITTPIIIHFMSKPRPWEGNFWPWGRAGSLPYIEFVRLYPQAARVQSPLKLTTTARYHLQQLFKRYFEDWGNMAMRERIIMHEQSVRI